MDDDIIRGQERRVCAMSDIEELLQKNIESCMERMPVAHSTCAPQGQFGRPIRYGNACVATMAVSMCASVVYVHNPYGPRGPGPSEYHRDMGQNTEQQQKAERKAKDLMVGLLGKDQAVVYDKTMRVILKPGKRFWVIGNIKGSYNKMSPFYNKPDVMRVDNPNKNHVTYFCVDQRGGWKGGQYVRPSTPYTDKVYAFAMHLQANERAFVRTINRIREDTLKRMPECARLGI